jgi:hypothetical protein
LNKYRFTFVATCPNNGEAIIYHLSIETEKRVMVEHIKTACALWKTGYHEEIAADLHERFGGHLTLAANHHGVDIETVLEEAT